MSYTKLEDDGIDMTLCEAREALSNGDGRVIEHDVPADDMQPCPTIAHKGQVWALRPHVMFEVPVDGRAVFVCRFCLYRLAHARLTRNHGLTFELLELARPHMEPLSILIDEAGHLTSSESRRELHWFALLLGLKPEWFQGGRHAHYDILGKRLHEKAVKLGARVVNPGRVAEAARELAKEADAS